MISIECCSFEISIHALLAESDLNEQEAKRRLLISIHALLAESDQMTLVTAWVTFVFLSTLSLRRATCVFFVV